MTRGRPPSIERSAIEGLLERLQPLALTQTEIAEKALLAACVVAKHMGNIVHAGRAVRTNPGQTPARYRWCDTATPRPTPGPRAAAPYRGEELQPYTGRCGAMRAYELPSLVNGVRSERRRPSLMASDVRNWNP